MLLLIGLVGCALIVASVGADSGSNGPKSQGSGGAQATVAIDEPVSVGAVTWTVANAAKTDQVGQQKGDPKKGAEGQQGNFVTVDFDFVNNADEPITLDNESLTLIDSKGRESTPSSDDLLFVPENRKILLERIHPGVTEQGRAIFKVAPGASGFKLQAEDAGMFTDEYGYVDLGF